MVFKVEHHTLSDVDSTNRKVPLAFAPAPFTVALDIISGTSQFDQTGFTDATGGPLSPDFTVDGTFVSWDDPSYRLYGQLTTGDKIRVIYEKV